MRRACLVFALLLPVVLAPAADALATTIYRGPPGAEPKLPPKRDCSAYKQWIFRGKTAYRNPRWVKCMYGA